MGSSVSVLLAQRHKVMALDVDEARVTLPNARKSPIQDHEIEAFLANRSLDLNATTDAAAAMARANFVVIATPTSYDAAANRLIPLRSRE